MKRTLEIMPAYDLRPKYGIHACELWASVANVHGALSVSFFTNWHLAHVQKEFFNNKMPFYFQRYPDGANLIAHHEKRVPGSTKNKKCEYTKSGSCYGQLISYLRADEFVEPILREGSDGLFKMLETEHARYFADFLK